MEHLSYSSIKKGDYVVDEKNQKNRLSGLGLGLGFVLYATLSMLMEKYANFIYKHWPPKRDKSCRGFVRPIGMPEKKKGEIQSINDPKKYLHTEDIEK